MIGTTWIYRLGKSLYSLKNPQISQCDLVVPLGYGILFQKKLPDAAKKTLREAFQITSQYQAQIAWANSNYFWPGCQYEENQLKLEEAENAGLTIEPIIVNEGITNTINEAQKIREAVIKTGLELQSKTIIIVADWAHARSASKIWKKVFPESTIIMTSIDGKWNESHPAFFQRSELLWLFINIFRHLALSIFGMKIVSLIHHPTSKKDV